MAVQVSSSLKAELIRAIPNMRAFALSLCGNSDRADDLVQETLVKAWDKIDTFEEGTNLKAWLFTILRNAYFSELRKLKREVPDPDGDLAANTATEPGQISCLHMTELVEALEALPPDQREAVVLVGAEGFAYDEAAAICGCAVGTIKSRVNRARNRLTQLMDWEDERSNAAPPKCPAKRQSIADRNLAAGERPGKG